MEKEIGCVKGLSIETVQNLRKILAAHKVPATVEGLQQIGIKGLYNFYVVPGSALIRSRSLDHILTALENCGVKMHITIKQFDEIEFSILGKQSGKDLKLNVTRVLEKHEALKESETLKTEERKFDR